MQKTLSENQSHSRSQNSQKEDQLKNVLVTIKSNPKFIKLLFYSLNSLENFVTPPNREIRTNAKLIINHEGLDILLSVAEVNVSNEEVLRVSIYII